MRLCLPTLLLQPFFCTCVSALLLLLSGTGLFAQSPYHKADPRRNQVIAVSGLNLRDAPGGNGRILTKVPFGDRVEIISDTAYAYVNYESPEVREHNYWMKARYAGRNGYVFDAYLYVPADKYFFADDSIPAGINDDYRLFTNRGSAGLTYDHFAYKWFGLYAKQDDCALQSVRPSYRYYPNEIDESVKMTVNDGPLPTFFIASKKSLKTGARPGTVISWEGTSEDTRAASDAICRDYHISSRPGTPGAWASSQELTLTIGNKSQHLNPGGRTGSAVYVEAATDIDGDGKTDFIISFDTEGFDYTFTFVLFLSSEARDGELVRPVAMQYVYSGC